ncbi:MAG: AI-2E family transporter [Patescibacteria group bacterium]
MPLKDSHRFLVAVLLFFFALFVFVLSGFLAPVVLGFLLAALSFPLYHFLAKRIHANLAALVVTILVVLIIIIPVSAALFALTSEAVSFANIARTQGVNEGTVFDVIEKIALKFGISAIDQIEQNISLALRNIGTFLTQEIGTALSNAFRFGINFFVMLITLFYVLRDGKAFGSFVMFFSPLKSQDELLIYRTFRETGKAVVTSTFAGALLQGVLGGLAFTFAGLASPVFWGSLMAFLGLIPFLGPFIVFVPAALYLFFIGKTGIAILFLLFNILIVSSVDNLIKPFIMGGQAHIHPLLSLLAILGGITAFGIIGIVYGPLIFAIFLALLKVYEESSKSSHTHS